jgi:hypothetical protein
MSVKWWSRLCLFVFFYSALYAVCCTLWRGLVGGEQDSIGLLNDDYAPKPNTTQNKKGFSEAFDPDAVPSSSSAEDEASRRGNVCPICRGDFFSREELLAHLKIGCNNPQPAGVCACLCLCECVWTCVEMYGRNFFSKEEVRIAEPCSFSATCCTLLEYWALLCAQQRPR